VEESPGRGRPTFRPATDLFESPTHYILVADVPGARAESVGVHLDRGQLTISAPIPERGSVGAPGRKVRLREYGVGDFERVFRLPPGIDPDGVQATCKDGVLTVMIAKPTRAQGRRIAVGSN
jgi:HSP20 family molecular chaperone IbpA